MLGLNKVIINAQRINWSLTSNFYVRLTPAEPRVQNAVGWSATSDFEEIIQISLKNIDLPQHTADLVEKITAGDWHFSRNEDEPYIVNLTFRDMWGGTLYRIFKNIWTIGKLSYPNYSWFNIEVYLTNASANNEPIMVFRTTTGFLSSISQVQLSHDNSEIMEFTVEFKTNEPETDFSKTIETWDGVQKDLTSSGSGNKYSKALEAGLNGIKSFANNMFNGISNKVTNKVTSSVKDFLNWD